MNLRKDHYRLDCMSFDVRVVSRDSQPVRLAVAARRVRNHACLSKLAQRLCGTSAEALERQACGTWRRAPVLNDFRPSACQLQCGAVRRPSAVRSLDKTLEQGPSNASVPPMQLF